MAVFSFFILIIYLSNVIVERQTENFIFDNLQEIPEQKVGIVLGTSRYLPSGKPNPYFVFRIQAAKALFFSGKIHYMILSGDNRFYSYNEPREMRKDLLRMGIPDSVIFMDFAGFRTLDSVVRGKRVYKLKRFTIISQKFHNQRAVYIARHNGIKAIGYNAHEPTPLFSVKVKIREYLARVAMMIDLYVLHKDPHFLGDEKLPEDAYRDNL